MVCLANSVTRLLIGKVKREDLLSREQMQNLMRTFNRDVRRLPRLMRRHGGLLRLEEMDEMDRDATLDCSSMLRTFLREVCNSQTSDREVASAAAFQTRMAFLKLLFDRSTSGLMGWIVAECMVHFVPPNVWLFLRAVDAVEEASIASLPTEAGSASNAPREAPPAGLPSKSAAKRGSNARKCPVDGVALRPGRHASEGLFNLRRSLRNRYCEIRCILTLLTDFGFTKPQIASALGLSRDSVTRYLERCEQQAKPDSRTASPHGSHSKSLAQNNHPKT